MNENTVWLNSYLEAFANGSSHFPIAKRITCNDGFSLSVQSHRGAYCEPRNGRGPWSSVEVGFPSAEPELISSYAEDPDNLTGTVYGYVDIELVADLIALHGGPNEETRAAMEQAKSTGEA